MKNNNKAFTLIELMVVITIIALLTLLVSAPYLLYQKKQQVRNSAKIVSQTLYEARNLAINGLQNSSISNDKNNNIGVLFKNGETDITIFEYPYGETIANYENASYEYEKKKLGKGVEFSGTGYLLIYDAITGNGRYLEGGSPYTDSQLEVTVGFQGATSGMMSKVTKYYTNTYVADVQ